MKRRNFLATTAALSLGMTARAYAAEGKDFPPGWLPVNRLTDEPTWSKTDDRVRLYLPPGNEPVRGVFVCFVFHSGDPRELARLWNFALVTVPSPFEFDLGVNDKRNGRYQVGHEMQDMSLLLRYLMEAAKETKHPELAHVPLVGWLGQNGSHLGANLFEQAPTRMLAWSDSFPDRLAKFPELTANVPFALAWELAGKEPAERQDWRAQQLSLVKDQLTPPPDLKCRANTYGFSHGIYSKFNFFMAFLDRCIEQRLPEKQPPAGEPVVLKPATIKDGWAGDYNEMGEWNAIAPAKDARGMVSPIWLPDEYAAWMWRSFHTHQPDIKLTAPIVEYRKRDGKWGGPECGLGYGGSVAAGTPLKFAATLTGEYEFIEFYDGQTIVGTASSKDPQVGDVKLSRGLHALFAVGVKPDKTRRASRPAFLVVTQ